MAMLFSLGQHHCGAAITVNEKLLQRELWVHARISLHLGKTQVWNRAGECPSACEEVDPEARVWKGDVSRPRSEQGLKILGTPVGQREYVTTKLDQLIAKHRVLLERIPAVNDLQSGLLTFSVTTRANFTSEMCSQSWPSGLLFSMMPTCGSVFVICWV